MSNRLEFVGCPADGASVAASVEAAAAERNKNVCGASQYRNATRKPEWTYVGLWGQSMQSARSRRDGASLPMLYVDGFIGTQHLRSNYAYTSKTLTSRLVINRKLTLST